MARSWAESVGLTVLPFAAEWKKYGLAAGPIRNKKMLVEGKPDYVVAFTRNLTTSKGTKNMVLQSRKAKLPVVVLGESKGLWT